MSSIHPMDQWELQAESVIRMALDPTAARTFARGVVGPIKWSESSQLKLATVNLSTAVKSIATHAPELESTMSVHDVEEL